MSGKRYFREHPELRNAYILNDTEAEVRVDHAGGTIGFFHVPSGKMIWMTAAEAIGLGMIAQQAPGHPQRPEASGRRGTMSEYTEALHEFVQASNRYETETHAPTRACIAAPNLATAGDRLESVLRQMMRDEANKVSMELYGYEGMR